jgi:endosialidase-like protein
MSTHPKHKYGGWQRHNGRGDERKYGRRVGKAASGTGVYGYSNTAQGVLGHSNSAEGVTGSSSSGRGVYGWSTTGIGVYGYSSAVNGVVGQNGRTDWAAAAISALTGGAHGLALYAGGDILVSGEAYSYGSLAWINPSDARIKKDITPLRLGLTQLKEVRPVTYKYNGLGGSPDDGREHVGVIAQELEKIFPNMVSSKKRKLHPDDAVETDIKVVDPSAFTYLLINSVKEQQAIIERQERRIAALERGRGLSASILGNGVEMAIAFGMLPLGFIALRRRKAAQAE